MSSMYLSSEHFINIAAGNVRKVSHINKFGYNDAVGTSWEPIRVGSELIVYPTTAATVSVVSANAGDTAAGTGARTVEIQGLDQDYNKTIENITLNGTTPVNTTKTFIRIFRIRVMTAGSNGAPEGNLTASIGGNVQITLDNTYDNQSLYAAYTIPANHDGYLLRVQATTTKDNKVAMVAIKTKSPKADSVWQIKQVLELYRNEVTVDFPVPLKFTEKTDIELRAKNLDAGTVSVGGTFDLILIER